MGIVVCMCVKCLSVTLVHRACCDAVRVDGRRTGTRGGPILFQKNGNPRAALFGVPPSELTKERAIVTSLYGDEDKFVRSTLDLMSAPQENMLEA